MHITHTYTHIHTRYEKLNSTRGICQQSLQGKRSRRGDKTELGWGLIREGNKEEVNLNIVVKSERTTTRAKACFQLHSQ